MKKQRISFALAGFEPGFSVPLSQAARTVWNELSLPYVWKCFLCYNTHWRGESCFNIYNADPLQNIL
jgi:hypothetical protein